MLFRDENFHSTLSKTAESNRMSPIKLQGAGAANPRTGRTHHSELSDIINLQDHALRRTQQPKSVVTSRSDNIGEDISEIQSRLNQATIARNFEESQRSNAESLETEVIHQNKTNDFLFEKLKKFKEINETLRGLNSGYQRKIESHRQVVAQLEQELPLRKYDLKDIRRLKQDIDLSLKDDRKVLESRREEKRLLIEQVDSLLKELTITDLHRDKQFKDHVTSESQLKTCTTEMEQLNGMETRLTRDIQTKLREARDLEERMLERKQRTDFLRSEVEELQRTSEERKTYRDGLLIQFAQLEEICEEFTRLRIDYAERLNQRVMSRNRLIQKINEDNSRLEALSQDMDRTLSNLRTNF